MRNKKEVCWMSSLPPTNLYKGEDSYLDTILYIEKKTKKEITISDLLKFYD